MFVPLIHTLTLAIYISYFRFEDGSGGSAQGLLGVGKETTTNTYEGHVFFFTEQGNKAKEVARVHITQDVSESYVCCMLNMCWFMCILTLSRFLLFCIL